VKWRKAKLLQSNWPTLSGRILWIQDKRPEEMLSRAAITGEDSSGLHYRTNWTHRGGLVVMAAKRLLLFLDTVEEVPFVRIESLL